MMKYHKQTIGINFSAPNDLREYIQGLPGDCVKP